MKLRWTQKKLAAVFLLCNIVVVGILLSDTIGTMRARFSWTTPFFPEEHALLSSEYNTFEEEQGLFRFQYHHSYEVKKYDDVYYVRDNMTHIPVFQIFVHDRDRYTFNEDNYRCYRYPGIERQFRKKELCFSLDNADNAVVNLEPFSGILQPQQVRQQFVEYGLVQEDDFDPYGLLRRDEALALILKMNYKDKNFEDERDDCFIDIDRTYPLSGYICYAKKNGIVEGVDDFFHPESTINLMGLLKIAFIIYEIDDRTVDPSVFDAFAMSNLTPIHAGYDIVAKGYYEGLFQNLTNESLWPNRNISFQEALDILDAIDRWHNGKQLKMYTERSNKLQEAAPVYVRNAEDVLMFEETDDATFSWNDTVESAVETHGSQVDIFVRREGNVYEHLYTLEDENTAHIASLQVRYDPERRTGSVGIIYDSGQQRVLESAVSAHQFAFLKTDALFSPNEESIARLRERHILPNSAPKPRTIEIPTLQFFLSDRDLENLFRNRTSKRRYPAFAEIVYPNGEVQSYSTVIKARGFATLSMIKSSFTVESFTDFEENTSYRGDEFLDNIDEVKLRAMINDPTMFREKLFYRIFEQLGYNAPRTIDMLVEINGIPMGLYQVTEPVKKDFFRSRNLDVKTYVYGENHGSSEHLANLEYDQTDEQTLSLYDINGKEEDLLALIEDLRDERIAILDDVNLQNLLDYGFFIYLFYGSHSLNHNYYVYLDETTDLWNILPWDADSCCKAHRPFTQQDILQYLRYDNDDYNALSRFVARNLSDRQVRDALQNFISRWNALPSKVQMIESFQQQYKPYYQYDNALWNGKFLERTAYNYDTYDELEELQDFFREIERL